jgi:hypothetical protein
MSNQIRNVTGRPPSIRAFMKSPDPLEYAYSDLPLSSGALCTRVTATRRSTRITAFIMATVRTVVCLRLNEVAVHCVGIYIYVVFV